MIPVEVWLQNGLVLEFPNMNECDRGVKELRRLLKNWRGESWEEILQNLKDGGAKFKVKGGRA